MRRIFEIEPEELQAVVMLYRLINPFMTPKRIYARWRAGKINLLKDYQLWRKDEFLGLCTKLEQDVKNEK